jgi:putative Holliday junction resolvase
MTDFKHFPNNGRLLGVDWGAKRTGLAVSDERQAFVFPRQIVNRAAEIMDFIKSEEIKGIVVGLPLHADGSDSETTAMVRRFAADLAAQTDLPIAFVEENLTSAAAREQLANQKYIDSAAASIILENAIAIIKRLGNAN